jgi:hypothetical protein
VKLDKDDIQAIAEAVVERLMHAPTGKPSGKNLKPYDKYEFSQVMAKARRTGNYKPLTEYIAAHFPPEEKAA